jgi:hypothetical protein
VCYESEKQEENNDIGLVADGGLTLVRQEKEVKPSIVLYVVSPRC